jgi:hypothetical protein
MEAVGSTEMLAPIYQTTSHKTVIFMRSVMTTLKLTCPFDFILHPHTSFQISKASVSLKAKHEKRLEELLRLARLRDATEKLPNRKVTPSFCLASL